MEDNLRKSILLRLNSTADALRKNQMDAYVVESKEELLNEISKLIGKTDTVFSGGSATLKEAGVIEMLENGGYDYYYRGRCDEDGNPIDVMRKAFYGDWFLTSSNAITLDGELYNVDGNANRVAALSFGPKNVIVIAGYNKVVKDVAEAVERVKAIAAPANCHSTDRICCTYTVHSFQCIAGRIKVFLLPEELGY